MKWTINPNQAIYPQIVEGFIKALISGELITGQKLPSVRELASDAAINPNTMQRALSELERRELVVNQRTSGKCVTENTEIINQVKKEFAGNQVKQFVTTMKEIGFSPEEIINIIKEQV